MGKNSAETAIYVVNTAFACLECGGKEITATESFKNSYSFETFIWFKLKGHKSQKISQLIADGHGYSMLSSKPLFCLFSNTSAIASLFCFPHQDVWLNRIQGKRHLFIQFSSVFLFIQIF